MKKMFLVILFSAIAAGVAYAGADTAKMQMAISLPQPGTIFICTAGIAFFRCLTLKK